MPRFKVLVSEVLVQLGLEVGPHSALPGIDLPIVVASRHCQHRVGTRLPGLDLVGVARQRDLLNQRTDARLIHLRDEFCRQRRLRRAK